MDASLMVIGTINIIVWLMVLYLAWKILGKIAAFTQVDVELAVRQEIRTGREEATASAKLLREEVGQTHKQANEILVNTLNALGNAQKERLAEIVTGMNQVVEKNRAEITGLKEEVKKTQKEVMFCLRRKWTNPFNLLGCKNDERKSRCQPSENTTVPRKKLVFCGFI